MVSQQIKAITFDFWRTLFYAHSQLDMRRDARVAAIAAVSGMTPDDVRPAFKEVSREFLRVHIAEQRTPRAEEAVPMLERQLGISFSRADADRLTAALSDVFLEYPPAAIEGALEAVRAAAAHVPVGLISDTGMTSGSGIRALLDRERFSEHIDVFVFSDEVGVAKPQAAVFHEAARALGVDTGALLHIGDLEPTDIAGALNVGARAALFAGDNDRYVEGSRAQYIFPDWDAFVRELPGLLA